MFIGVAGSVSSQNCVAGLKENGMISISRVVLGNLSNSWSAKFTNLPTQNGIENKVYLGYEM